MIMTYHKDVGVVNPLFDVPMIQKMPPGGTLRDLGLGLRPPGMACREGERRVKI